MASTLSRHVHFAFVLLAVLFSAEWASAQEPPYPQVEVFGSVGSAKYYSDYWFPDPWRNVGFGLGVRLSPRLGVEVELNRMLGVSPGSVSGVAFIPSRPGSTVQFVGREGFTSMTLASGSLVYYFSKKRVQPYLTGGLGVGWERGVTFFYPDEKEFRATQRYLALGGGIRVSITRAIAIRPEFKVYGPVYGIGRASVAVAYQW